jgi:hypothetical protein
MDSLTTREDPMDWDIICKIYGWDRILDWFRWEYDPTSAPKQPE